MSAAAKRVRGSDGVERVLVELPEFQALLDAASASAHGLPDVRPIVERIRHLLDSDEPTVDLDELLQQYDAVHGSR